MAMSGPSKPHHHDDDEGPAVFGEINITPLTDIFLVLLIIFMVTSTALVEQGQGGSGAGVRVDLPKGAAREIAQEAKDFPIGITAEGQIVIEGKAVDLDTLRLRLVALVKETPQIQVIIQADTGTQHGKVVAAIEAAKDAGIERVAIATNAGK